MHSLDPGMEEVCPGLDIHQTEDREPAEGMPHLVLHLVEHNPLAVWDRLPARLDTVAAARPPVGRVEEEHQQSPSELAVL